MRFVKQIQEIITFLENLPPHEKLQELSKIMLFKGRYRVLKNTLSSIKFVFILDLVNYSKMLFLDPLPIEELLNIFAIEPSYSSLTGNLEIGHVIRKFEASRAYAFANHYNRPTEDIRPVIQNTMVVSTFGATGAIYTMLMALSAKERATGKNRTSIVFNAPTYYLADAFARLNGLNSIPVHGTRKEGFIPSPAQIHEACQNPSVFACVLTYPSNPAQNSFKEDEISELVRLIEYCQSHQIGLIADTIFQELRWASAPPVPEIFALTDSASCLCKVFSPSKDHPFACGYRVGYLMADKNLEPWLERVASCATTSPNTLSQIWLAIDSVFRRAMIEGELNEELFLPLKGSALFGFSFKRLGADEIYQKISDAALYPRYVENINQFRKKMDLSLDKVWHSLNSNAFFEVDARPSYGNTLLVRIPRQDKFSNELEYYFHVLLKAGVIGSIGGCFGLPDDDYIYFRVVVGSYPPEVTIAALEHVRECLSD